MEFYVRSDKNSMGCYVRGDKNSMGCFVRGDKNSMGCFVRGVKKWHGVFCPAMFCPAPDCHRLTLPVQHHSYVDIGHETFSTVGIIPIPSYSKKVSCPYWQNLSLGYFVDLAIKQMVDKRIDLTTMACFYQLGNNLNGDPVQ